MTDRPTARDIRRLLPLVRQLLKADGFEARSFGNLELKSVISEVFDGVSNDDDNSRAAYRKLRRTGKGRLRKIDAEALEALMNPDLLGPRHALAWATLDAQANPELFQAVRAVRQRFWEVSEAPFPAFPGGREQAEGRAAQWLETQRQYASPFQRGELRIACSAGDWGAANFAFNEVINSFSDDPDWKVAGQPIAPLLVMLSERLARENVKVEVFRGFPGEGLIEGEFKAVTDFLSILPNKSVPVPPDGPLRELNELIDRVVVSSGWWEKHQALHYVMTGYPPTPLIHRSVHKTVPPFYYRLPSRAGGSGTLKMPIFDIRVEVPISHEEWRQLLPRVTTANGRRPKRLTVTHVALLQLKAQTPESSWAYRLALWEEWRRNYPKAGLKEFSSERLIRKQWALAGQYVVAWMSASDPWGAPKPRTPVR